MLVPVRCFTCGSLVGDKHDDFVKRVNENEDPRDVLNDLGLNKYCCRKTILSNVDIIDQILPYYQELAKRHAEFASENL